MPAAACLLTMDEGGGGGRRGTPWDRNRKKGLCLLPIVPVETAGCEGRKRKENEPS